MSPKSDGFKDFILDQLTDLHHVTCRAMLGGHGLYQHGLYQKAKFFGIIQAVFTSK